MGETSLVVAGSSATGKTGPKIVVRVPVEAWVLEKFQAAYPEADLVYCPYDEGIEAHIEDIEVVIGSLGLKVETLLRAPKLRWFQVLGVGVEKFTDEELIRRQVTVTTGRGVNVTQLSEHALAMMLYFARGLGELKRRQDARSWLPGNGAMLPTLSELSGSRLCLFGYGAIGQQIALRARAFGMEVWALRRNAGTSSEPDPYAARILPPEAFHELVAAADHLFLMAPLTKETTGIMDAEAFSLMKASAYFYNMGRGSLVDQDAMIAALRDRRIAGAGLDATHPEPLPPESPLWDLENVLITAHTAGNTPRFYERIVGFVCENLGRYRAGQPLLNPVDLRAGY